LTGLKEPGFFKNSIKSFSQVNYGKNLNLFSFLANNKVRNQIKTTNIANVQLMLMTAYDSFLGIPTKNQGIDQGIKTKNKTINMEFLFSLVLTEQRISSTN
jgi:hypothetical protein